MPIHLKEHIEMILYHYFFPFRIFSHPNVLPVIGAVNDSKNLVVLSQYLPFGSLYNVLHEGTGG